MSLKRFVLTAGALSAGLAAFGPVAAAQEQPAQQPGQQQRQDGERGNRGERGERRQFDPEEMRQRMSQRMKEMLGATDEEWAVLAPKVEKVTTLSAQAAAGRGGGMGMLFRGGGGGDRGGDRGDRGDRGGRGGFFGGGDSPVAQRTRELQEAIRNNATAEEIKTKLAAVRDARSKAKAELTQAQQELRELLTVKQEATLVTMGMLE